MQRIPIERRHLLSRAIIDARNARRWDQIALADEATTAVCRIAEVLGDDGIEPTPEELAAWEDLEVTRHHVAKLETCPAYPVGTLAKKGRLLAICIALNLDRDEVNRLINGM